MFYVLKCYNITYVYKLLAILNKLLNRVKAKMRYNFIWAKR